MSSTVLFCEQSLNHGTFHFLSPSHMSTNVICPLNCKPWYTLSKYISLCLLSVSTVTFLLTHTSVLYSCVLCHMSLHIYLVPHGCMQSHMSSLIYLYTPCLFFRFFLISERPVKCLRLLTQGALKVIKCFVCFYLYCTDTVSEVSLLPASRYWWLIQCESRLIESRNAYHLYTPSPPLKPFPRMPGFICSI